MGNKVNAAARSFCFLLIRAKSTLSMPGIFDFYTLMYLKARDLRVESSLFLTQPQAGSPVPRSWLGTCHRHLAGIKHLILQLLHFMRLQPCSYLWLTASKPPVKYFHHYWCDKSCKSKAQFLILLYPSSFWDVPVVQKQWGTDTFVSHFPKGYSIAIIWGKR